MSIDWATLGLQALNVLILVWLLARFFWRPVAGMIEQRRAAAQALLADAGAKNEAAKAALAEITQTRAGFAQEREALLAQAQAQAAAARAALLAEAAQEAEALRREARAAMQTEQAAAAQAWRERASRLAVDIAARLAARLQGEAVQAAFLEYLLHEIQALPPAARQVAALEVASATEISAAAQSEITARISAALGAAPRITFKTEPALIAGLELRGPHLRISNSWRADLDRIEQDLTHDG
ncbi:ATP synthase subunit b [Acidocella aquatica]|uniref:ATP synthase subunit b n=1 Tax=Acidocella aquatica TaxID=1922313 RepID=A0ABQ6A8A8_9PROT|nr:F0F1 ATP synthase subunit delta [Acidocella aquatica]GLR67883.1 ATP synthase subunit b [Acidocella aquatica]